MREYPPKDIPGWLVACGSVGFWAVWRVRPHSCDEQHFRTPLIVPILNLDGT
jgi:hypothetical protein